MGSIYLRLHVAILRTVLNCHKVGNNLFDAHIKRFLNQTYAVLSFFKLSSTPELQKTRILEQIQGILGLKTVRTINVVEVLTTCIYYPESFMRIAYILSRYPTLSETFIAREMQELARLGHDITICPLKWSSPWSSKQGLQVSPASVIMPQFGPLPWVKGLIGNSGGLEERGLIWQDVKQSNYQIVSQTKLLLILLTVLRLAQLLEDQGIEHIRANFLHSEAVGAMWLAQLLKVPYSVTAHTLVTFFPDYIIEKIVQKASFCVAITTETRELLTKLLGSKNGIHLIRNGVDLKEFDLFPDVSLKSNPVLIIGVGRLVEKKGFDVLIQACSLLRDWGVDYTCKIIGTGPQYSYLRKLINTLNLDTRVSLVGALPFDQVKHYYRKASVLIMPSRVSSDGQDRDGLPAVIYEALAAYLPVVATTIAGIPDLIVHNQTGLLVPPDDATSVARATRQILEDKNMRLRFIQAGREKVNKEFDINVTAKQLDLLIHRSNQSNGN